MLGVDLGSTAAMSACSMYDLSSGYLEAFGVLPELPELGEKGTRDGVGPLYLTMARRGELLQLGRRVSDVGAMLREALERWGPPALVVADRFREGELRQELEAAALPFCPLELRGMGWRDGAEDVRDFRAACLSDGVHPTRSLLLRSALAEARTLANEKGDEKLGKSMEGGRRQHARDDAIAASVLAIAAGWRRRRYVPAETLTHVVLR